ncbi:MAG: alpha/beta fold hydrolase, partial [Steroidobacteraceae bacterium]|nr:alpha/beta fold hydrolase [Steroidobacteraceae bacterium]
TVLALDTPGYGYSAPLPDPPRPEIPNFAQALQTTLTALGVERCALYGFHTSSKIVLQFAVDYPERVALAVLDGLNLPPGGPDETFIARYMEPLPIASDGSHLTMAWARAREFMRFFPWFDARAATRLQLDFPDDDALHCYVLDLVLAGPNYSSAYAAAMRYAALPRVSALRAPTVFLCRSNDPLYRYLDDLPQPLPPGCSIERLGPDRSQWKARLRALFAAAALKAQVGMPRRAVSDHVLRRGYVDVAAGQMHFIAAGPPSGRPLLLLPDLPGTVAGDSELIVECAHLGHRVFALDLPGQGASTAMPLGREGSCGDYVDALVAALDSLGCDALDCYAGFAAAPFALMLAARTGPRVRALALDGLPLFGRRERTRLVRDYCPPLAVRPEGSHLYALWQRLRDQELNWPWYERAQTGIRRVDPNIGAERLHRMTVELAQQLSHYGDAARAALAIDVAPLLRVVAQPVLLFQDPNDPRLATSPTVAHRLERGVTAVRPRTAAALAKAISDFLLRV